MRLKARIGKKTLALVSVRKVPGAKNAKELLPSVLLNAQNDAGVNAIVVESPSAVNGGIYNNGDFEPSNPDTASSELRLHQYGVI